jgi:CheY-like chemotaxis protein
MNDEHAGSRSVQSAGTRNDGSNTAAPRAPEPKNRDTAGVNGFISALAHELRNFAAPIRNVASILRMRNAAELDTRSLSELIDRQINAIGKIVDDLAEADQASRGNIALEVAPVDLVEAINEAVSAQRALLDERNQVLHLSLPKARVSVRADRGRLVWALRCVIGNLSVNTKSGGQVWIDSIPAADEFCVTLRDDGIGIKPADLPRIFDYFSVEERPERPWRPDLGMSLAMAKSLIELHQGFITVKSDGPGKGRKFMIGIPLDVRRNAEQGARDAPAAGAQATRGIGTLHGAAAAPGDGVVARRILIADDNAALRESLGGMLQQMGHETRAAAGGDEALRIAREWMPQVVFVDVNMPGINGFELARMFRSEFQPSSIKLVLMSGDGLSEMVLRGARNAGFDRCIDKLSGASAFAGILNDASA